MDVTPLLVILGICVGLAAAAALLTRLLQRRPTPEKEEAPGNEVLRAKAGHLLRSRGELLIANYLDARGVPYEYEPKVAGYTPDFFVREHRLIIEYWGLIGHRRYDAHRDKKIARYKAEGYRVIGLTPRHVHHLDATLGRKLKKYYPDKFRDL